MTDSEASSARSRDAWQRDILPFAKRGLIVLGATVVVGLVLAGWGMYSIITQGSAGTRELTDTYVQIATSDDQFDAVRAGSTLGAYQAARRHDFARASLLTRDTLRLAGFLIGAALTFVGSIFILAQIGDSTESNLGAAAGGYQLTLATSSPGLFTMTLGSLIIGFSLLIHTPIEVNDAGIEASSRGEPTTESGEAAQQNVEGGVAPFSNITPQDVSGETDGG
ncbi:hypothetical protein [Maricaulis salignorans]|uniref:Uncharacterized protein n=1 Tax=Maricaulis salignorans TaxID=144026 RepID=A0A1G9U6H6_9PROT|nr:hypothetical protein [Maricaulis salignorans]SDM55478.1 hypothetical protein SAMN04488568_11412 [Maricaulis salignorans]